MLFISRTAVRQPIRSALISAAILKDVVSASNGMLVVFSC